ncbi:MAG: DUF3786 domain-containing protein [Candidatus Magnetoovum sp. WYHC-5]|nr:DUF3786 domain-containing protein [Candidatus Magnetoovum sp. WYHC-5]
MISGEVRRWEILNGLAPESVCQGAGVNYNQEEGAYVLTSFGWRFVFYTKKCSIVSIEPEGEVLLSRYGDFFRLSSLWYLTNAQNIPFTNELLHPQDLREGQLFYRGSHVLPLHKLANVYGNNKEGFLKKGQMLGGSILTYGDCSIGISPFPRIYMALILWLQDDEFPARADLLFDKSCERQLPVDIAWSTAMMSILMMFP